MLADTSVLVLDVLAETLLLVDSELALVPVLELACELVDGSVLKVVSVLFTG